MPRVSSAQKDAFHFKGTFEDGWGEVLDAKALMFQFPPVSNNPTPERPIGHQDPPALFAELTIQRYIDKNTKTALPPEAVTLYSIARQDKAGILGVRPGNYPDGDLAADPVDCGDTLGAEGNTVFAITDGFQFNDKSKWMQFAASLEEKGFKPTILERTFFPDLIGMVAEFKTVTSKKFRADQQNDPTKFVVTEIARFPYEGKNGTKAVTKAVTKAASTVKASGGPATASGAVPAAEPSGEAASETDAEPIAVAVLTAAVAKLSGSTLPSINKFRVSCITEINNHKPPIEVENRKAVQAFFKSEEWLKENGMVLDVDFLPDGTVTVG